MAHGRATCSWVCNSAARRGFAALTLTPGAEEQATFTYRTKVAGYLEARINPHDAFPQDDRAVIELPAQQSLTRRGLFRRSRSRCGR